MKTDVKLPNEESKEPAPSEPKMKPVDEPTFFQKAKTVARRLKLFLWGDFGTGKTTLALRFPKPVVIDMEAGTVLYGDAFDFDVMKATTAEQVYQAIDWLLTHKHPYRTLVIDPVTLLWDAVQRRWSTIFLNRNKSSKGFKHEFFEFGPKEWMVIKSEFKDFIRKLLALDMNVIVTARQKPLYKEGSFMVSLGETFDGEKSLPYMFDTIVRLFVDEQGHYMAQCLKDRSNRLPKEPFEARYETFESLLGKESLSREAAPILPATDEQKAKIHGYIEKLGLSSDYVEERLATYGAESIDDLSASDADTIIKKLQATLSAKTSKK